ncbi:hypothetical protein PFISCL1PPCAC_25361, partial [Pristionchus fissidentatus]
RCACSSILLPASTLLCFYYGVHRSHADHHNFQAFSKHNPHLFCQHFDEATKENRYRTRSAHADTHFISVQSSISLPCNLLNHQT